MSNALGDKISAIAPIPSLKATIILVGSQGDITGSFNGLDLARVIGRGLDVTELIELQKELSIMPNKNSLGMYFLGSAIHAIDNAGEWKNCYYRVLEKLTTVLNTMPVLEKTSIVTNLRDVVLLNVDTTHPTTTLTSSIIEDYLINSLNETLETKGLVQSVAFDYNANNNYYSTYQTQGGDASQQVANWVLYVLYLNFRLRIQSADYVDVLMPALPADRSNAKDAIASIFDDMASCLSK